uniref:Uncharacterized protein n=1 Tax=Astatotilapia calliptera TaxID=8154 RepID=A0A3P8Q8I9_ASTCA
MENTYTYSKHCCEFGRQCHLALNFSQKSHWDLATQTGVEMSEHEGCSQGLNHQPSDYGGGWPKDIDPAEKKQTSLFRNKVEKDESYINSVLQLCRVRSK